MRYEELTGPLNGWTYDEAGTIYSPTGYRCSARTLECALWLFQCYSLDATRWLMRSDTRPDAHRPLHSIEDGKSGSAGSDCRGKLPDRRN